MTEEIKKEQKREKFLFEADLYRNKRKLICDQRHTANFNVEILILILILPGKMIADILWHLLRKHVKHYLTTNLRTNIWCLLKYLSAVVDLPRTHHRLNINILDLQDSNFSCYSNHVTSCRNVKWQCTD